MKLEAYHETPSTLNADEWQREVYLTAANLMRSNLLRTVYDIGCGSGYKTVHYLGEFDTTGFDLERTVLFLKKTYPDRKWGSVQFLYPGISTILLGSRRHRGSPSNITHMREWSFQEFGSYIGSKFRIIEHQISNRRQRTQMIACRKMK